MKLGIAVSCAALLGLASAACSTLPAATPISSAPVASAGPLASAVVVNVVVTNEGCAPDRASVPAGPVAISVANQGADKVSELELMEGERVVAERENLTPGLSATIALVLESGSYTLYCPGATTEKSPFTVN